MEGFLKCPNCSKKFSLTVRNKKFCSTKCTSNYHNNLRKQGLKYDATFEKRSIKIVSNQYFDWREYKNGLIV